MAFKLLIFCPFLLLLSCENITNTNPSSHETINIKNESFLLEIARTETSREAGMQNRKIFPQGTGIIFVFPKPEILNFWMKNCFFDIDILYLDSQGRILALYEMKQEPAIKPQETVYSYEKRLKHYSSLRPAKYAIELPPGTLRRLKLKKSEKININYKSLLNGAK